MFPKQYTTIKRKNTESRVVIFANVLNFLCKQTIILKNTQNT